MAKKQPVEKPFLFVDLSNLVYKNASSLHFLRTKDGEPTGGIFGTVRNLLTWSKSFRVWVFADGRSTHRKDLLSTYKAGRSDTQLPTGQRPVEQTHMDVGEEEVLAVYEPQAESLKKVVYSNIDALVEFLPKFGFPIIRHPDWEADDLIGACVYLRERYSPGSELPEVYIISTDKDFDQLPAHRLSTLKAHAKIATGKSPIKDTHLFEAKSLLAFPEIPRDSFLFENPHLLVIYRAITGDVSDKIKGIYTPSKLWKKKDEAYWGDTLIQSVCQVLPGATTYLGLVWDLERALNYVEKPLLESLDSRLWSQELAEKLILNLRLTKIPFDLLKAVETPLLVYQSDGNPDFASLASFFIPGKLPFEFTGWHPEMGTVREICDKYQMPSLIEKIAARPLMTESHLKQTVPTLT